MSRPRSAASLAAFKPTEADQFTSLRFLARGGEPRDNARMARYLVGVCGLALFACGEPEPAPVSKDLLVLELGGQHEQLDVALRRAGAIASPQRESAEPVAQTMPSPAAEPQPEPAEPTPRAEPPATVDPTPAPVTPPPAPVTPPRTVELREGQTIYSLAGEHLGASNRWREILEFNGWTEADASRLRAGQVV